MKRYVYFRWHNDCQLWRWRKGTTELWDEADPTWTKSIGTFTLYSHESSEQLSKITLKKFKKEYPNAKIP